MKKLIILISLALFSCGAPDEESYTPTSTAPPDPCVNMTDQCKGCASVCDKLIESPRCHVYDTAQQCCPRDYRYCMVACMTGSCSYTYEYLAVYDCDSTAVHGECVIQ